MKIKDCEGNEAAVGDRIEVLSIYEGLLNQLPEEELPHIKSMLHAVLEIEEITDDGYATVGKWVDEGDDRHSYYGLSLLPHEFRLVSKAS